MSALKEFADFVTLNTASLAETYAQLLAESDAGFKAIQVDSRLATGRKLLKAVTNAFDLQTSDPLNDHFNEQNENSTRRWPKDLDPGQPLVELECLGQTLTPVVTNLEAGKFLWQMLAGLRIDISRLVGHMPAATIGLPEPPVPVVKDLTLVQTITEVAQEIASAPVLEDFFRRVVSLVQGRFNYYHAHIYTLQADRLIVQAGTGEAGGELKETGHQIDLAAKQSLVARVARSGEPVLIGDVATEPAWLPNPMVPETRAELAVPIRFKDKVLGVLDVQSDEVNGLNQEDQILLMGLCGQIAVAINHHRLEAERVQTEAGLHETEQKYKELVDSMPVGIFRSTPGSEGLFVETNPATVAMFETNSKEELLAGNLRDYYQDPAEAEVFEEQLLRDGFLKEEEVRLKTATDKEIWGAVTAVKKVDEAGQVYFDGVIEDITERKWVEKELLSSKDLLTKTIDTIPDPIFVKDEQHRWIILNSAFCDFMGYGRDELLGKSDYDYFPKEEADVFWDKDEAVFNSGVENYNEESFTDASGQTHVISTKKSVFKDAAGRKILVGIIRDITDVKSTEKEAQSRASREQTIREITAKLQRAPTLEALAQTAAEELSKALNTSHGVVKLGLLEDP